MLRRIVHDTKILYTIVVSGMLVIGDTAHILFSLYNDKNNIAPPISISARPTVGPLITSILTSTSTLRFTNGVYIYRIYDSHA